MLNITRLQLLEGLRDAKFLFLSTIILVAFLVNGIVYTGLFHLSREDFQSSVVSNREELKEAAIGPEYFSRMYGPAENPRLQFLAKYEQRLTAPPSPLIFLADGGDRYLPNVILVNAFGVYENFRERRENEEMPVLPPLDWSLIVGALMTLLAILVSYASFAGEKSSGTLRQLLSNPLSRFKLFAGKYLGLLAVLMVALVLGVLVNLAAIVFLEGPPITAETLEAVGWAFLLSVLCVSAFLFLGMAVSAMTHHPSVALVVLLVLWIIAVVILPGLGRLLAEQLIEVPSKEYVEEEQTRVKKEVEENAPEIWGTWRGNPFDEHIPIRADVYREVALEQQRIRENAFQAQVGQVTLAKIFSSISPSGLLSDSMQTLAGSGVRGFEILLDNADRYRRMLYSFVIERDRLDPDSPHIVYPSGRSFGMYSDRGTFSLKEVPMEAVPAPESLWNATGLSRERPWPNWQLLILLLVNLQMALIAFIALVRYDPR